VALQHDISNHGGHRSALTIALLAGAKGKLEAAAPIIGTAIAVLLLICAAQGLPAVDRVWQTLAPQNGLLNCWCVLAAAMDEHTITPVSVDSSSEYVQWARFHPAKALQFLIELTHPDVIVGFDACSGSKCLCNSNPDTCV